MTGGTISGNTANITGGGVVIAVGVVFVMDGGALSGNTAKTWGGGLYIGTGGAFTLGGGIIGGNTADRNGGGVGIALNGRFQKRPSASSESGILYGNDASGDLQNSVANGGGHAVYAQGNPPNVRNSTLDAAAAFDSSLSGQAGGWE
jgi:hypothetical protein